MKFCRDCLHYRFSSELSDKEDTVIQECKKCNTPMKEGIAIQQTYTKGSPDFIGGDIVTMSPGGAGKLIPCLKCPKCGYSITKELIWLYLIIGNI